MTHWLASRKSPFTDDRGDFDPANIMVILGVLAILAIDAWAVIVNKQTFDAMQAGSGCAALVAALLASKWGDAKVRSVTPPVDNPDATKAQPPQHVLG